jgi:hypothetical protein
MISPFEFEEAGHSRAVPHPSVPHDTHNAKTSGGVLDFVVVLIVVAIFAGALFFILPCAKKTAGRRTLSRERWKDWRPLDE